MSYDEQYPEDTEESYYAEMDAALKPKTHTLALPEWQVQAILEDHCTRFSVPMEPQPAEIAPFQDGLPTEAYYGNWPKGGEARDLICSYAIGDRLVVRIREGDKRPEEIFFTVTSISAGRVQDVTDAQAIAEGVDPHQDVGGFDPELPLASEAHAEQWDADHDNPEHKWSANPWVWICEFEKASPCLK